MRGTTRSVRFLILALGGGAALAIAAIVCGVRVPPGHLGVARPGALRASILTPGFHLRPPFSPVYIYPETATSLEGRAEVPTPEGARISIRYSLTAAIDPARAVLLPPSSDAIDPEKRLVALLARMLEESLSRPVAVEELGALEPNLRRHLEASGLRVESLTIHRVSEQRAGILREPVASLESPIVLVGLDGADWQILDPLIGQGRVPNLARLKARAAWGHLRSYEPILSPLLWTTAVTGKPPDEHGIIDFLVPDPATGRRLPITSRARKVRALWNIFSEHGLTSDVIAWWASWPAEDVRGRIVSDRVAYSLFEVESPQGQGSELTHPEGLWPRLAPALISDSSIGHERVARFLDITRPEFEAARGRAAADPEKAYKEPVNHLAKILASTETYHRIALKLLEEGQPDLFAVYYQGIDEVSHRFAHFMPPRMDGVSQAEFEKYSRAVEEFYVYQDELLGELFDRLSPGSRLIVMSDHGFQNGPSRPTDGPADIEGKPGKWHRLYGVIMVAGQGIPAGRLDTATLYDITPTVLALAGLPLAEDMNGEPLLNRPAEDGAPARIASYESDRPFGARGTQDRAGGQNTPSAARIQADEELLQNLASLGYIGGSPSVAMRGAGERPAAPETITAHTNLASVLLQKGDLSGAERELRKALDRMPGYFPALMTLSQVLVRQGRVDEALQSVRHAVATAKDPEHPAYVQLALLAVRAGRETETVRLLETLRKRRPRAAGVLTALGTLAVHGGSPDQAEAHFREALELEPTSAEAMGQLFLMYRGTGREANLEGLIRDALRLNDRLVLHHNWLGLIHARRGDRAGAEREFLRALDLAPDFGGTMANLGSHYGRTGRLEEAVDILSRAVRIEPRNLEARVNLGAALGKLGRLDAAIANLEEARALGVSSPGLLNAVGLAYAQKGEKGRAIEALKESLALSPDQPEVTSLLAELARPT